MNFTYHTSYEVCHQQISWSSLLSARGFTKPLAKAAAASWYLLAVFLASQL